MNLFKALFYRFMIKLLDSPVFRDRLYEHERDLFTQPHLPSLKGVQPHELPIPYRRQKMGRAERRSPSPIFITARFRSGSTFLWQLFRNIDGITCYYEPLNERRWFLEEGALKVDSTHLGVKDYRREYQGMQDLEGIFDLNWPFRYLYMDATHHDPRLKDYIDALIGRAMGRPVLQFNRVDFRLQWLKANYPEAKIVHLYRDPREQWMSIIGKAGVIKLDASYKAGQLSGDNDFYTLEWARDLRHVFPFLEPAGRHPYEIHYLLWRLSYMFGKSLSDISIGYEELVTDFDTVMTHLLKELDIRDVNLVELAALNQGKLKNRWQEYATDDWFAEIESRCEHEVEKFLATFSGR
jgi:hypothetical protein